MQPGHLVFLALGLALVLAARALVRRVQQKLAARRWAKAPQRDVSALAGTGEADFKREVVTTTGPLKPNHRRLVVRDKRLLPKPPPDPNRGVWPAPKKPKYLTESEADRLFGPSLRTRNRDVMDLATDEAQLERYGLPVWKTEEDVAAALSISVGQLRHLSQHRHRETVPHYVTFAIPKRSGGERLIGCWSPSCRGASTRTASSGVGPLPPTPPRTWARLWCCTSTSRTASPPSTSVACAAC
jgi:hypothetical protein